MYRLSERELPLHDDWDVLVAGGGPAGCAAAVAAARNGARTVLLEAAGMLGGMGTAGLVPWFCGYGDGQKIIARGLAERVRQGLIDGMPHLREVLTDNPLGAPAIDPELLKRIYDDLAEEAGVEIRFHTRLCAVETSDDGVTAVLAADKDGLAAWRAKVFVDCTGDGDLAAWAGAPFEKGGADGGLQPATHCFMIANIDEAALARGPRVHFYDPESPIWQAVADPEFPLIEELHSCNIKLGPGVYGFNTGHVFGVDNTDPPSTTAGLLQGRRQAAQYRDALAKYHPAFARSMLVATGSQLGIRESRRVLGDYVLTEDDYLHRRSFADEICRCAYNLDVHRSRAESLELSKKSVDELKAWNRDVVRSLDPGESFGVPYRCLTPRGLRNLLVAGRCISADRLANGSIRIMACCLNTGEAAGEAAALAAAGAGDVHTVDTAVVRRRLQRHGAWLPPVEAKSA